MIGETLKLIALIVPMGLDTFGVALALGIAGLPAHQRLRIAFLFAGFETVMPLVGVALGVPLGHALGEAADYAAAGLIVALGVYMLVERAEDAKRLLSLTRGGVGGAVALGVSISLDEVAIGFSAGLLRLPILTLALALGAQAFIVTQAGLRVGARVSDLFRETSERLAGVALICLGAVLLVEQLTSP